MLLLPVIIVKYTRMPYTFYPKRYPLMCFTEKCISMEMMLQTSNICIERRAFNYRILIPVPVFVYVVSIQRTCSLQKHTEL